MLAILGLRLRFDEYLAHSLCVRRLGIKLSLKVGRERKLYCLYEQGHKIVTYHVCTLDSGDSSKHGETLDATNLPRLR